MKPTYYPSYEKFKELSGKGNMVPVYRQLLADTLTPVSAFKKISTAGHAFLLESASGGEKMARYSFIGAKPFMELSCRGNQTEITRNGKKERLESRDPIDTLRKEIEKFTPVNVDELPYFTGGAVGYFSYDAVRYTEELPVDTVDDLKLPDVLFMFFDSVIVFDHQDKVIKVIANAFLDGTGAESAYKDAVRRIDDLVDMLRTPVESVSADITTNGRAGKDFSSNFDKEDFLRAVERCKEYIRAGDVFQVVISQRLGLKTKAKPLDIYRALRVINPSPYMFYLDLGELKLIGSSPEVMVKVDRGKVTVRPIAGTRRRGRTEEEDKRMEDELVNDPKEQAEHVMLVDLGRNDVGRVAEYGSVHLEDRMIVERYSHVMHITSSVTGRLRPDKTLFDTLRSCLPAGTLSGAPKVRAMEIIEELEPTRRGPYGGAVGYIDFSGNMDTCITIRTIVLIGDTAYVQAGAGIVADSVPELEYKETLNKARGLMVAIETAETLHNSG
ncbi:MAG: anthranilate synthase component I [Candidatus Brocadiales bacterium]|nr:anthranilate synthase component I [Candidatus Bathyanammoxibius sp.]